MEPDENPIHEHTLDTNYGDMNTKSRWWERRHNWKDKEYAGRCGYRWRYTDSDDGAEEIIQCGMAAWKHGLCHYHYRLLEIAKTKSTERAAKRRDKAIRELERAEAQLKVAEIAAEAAHRELER